MSSRVLEIVYKLKDLFSRPSKKIDEALKSTSDESDKASRKITLNNKFIKKSFDGLKNSAAVAGKAILSAFAAVSGTVAAVFNATSTYQNLSASLKTVTGSAENAREAFEFISDFAKSTPFELNEVANAFIKLKSLGLDPSEEALRSYGNTASAMGKSLDQFIEAVADASAGEFERLKEFGIRASKQGEEIAFTFQNVTTTVGNNSTEIEAYLRRIGETQFSGAMEEQMKTLGGQLSNLKDAFFRLAVDIGNSGADTVAGSVLQYITQAVENTSEIVKQNSDLISESFNKVIGTLRFFGNAFLVVFNLIEITAKGLVRAMFGFAADINGALAAITFGDTSREFSRNAQAMRDTVSQLEQDIGTDVDDIRRAVGGIGESFNPIELQKKVEEGAKQAKPEVEWRMRTDVQEAVNGINAAISQAQQQIKPIEVPVVYRRGNSFSDKPFEDEVSLEAIKRGRRG